MSTAGSLVAVAGAVLKVATATSSNSSTLTVTLFEVTDPVVDPV